eukprot:1828-Heterococcus_DN1.PRE.1
MGSRAATQHLYTEDSVNYYCRARLELSAATATSSHYNKEQVWTRAAITLGQQHTHGIDMNTHTYREWCHSTHCSMALALAGASSPYLQQLVAPAASSTGADLACSAAHIVRVGLVAIGDALATGDLASRAHKRCKAARGGPCVRCEAALACWAAQRVGRDAPREGGGQVVVGEATLCLASSARHLRLALLIARPSYWPWIGSVY